MQMQLGGTLKLINLGHPCAEAEIRDMESSPVEYGEDLRIIIFLNIVEGLERDRKVCRDMMRRLNRI